MEALIKEFARLRKTIVLKIREGDGEDAGKTVFVLASGHKFIMTQKELSQAVDELKSAKAKEPNFDEPVIEAEPKPKKKKSDSDI